MRQGLPAALVEERGSAWGCGGPGGISHLPSHSYALTPVPGSRGELAGPSGECYYVRGGLRPTVEAEKKS